MNAWIIVLIVIGVIYFFFHVKSHGSKVGAAKNVLLAKYTFLRIDSKTQSKIIDRTKDILKSGRIRDADEKLQTLSERERYSFYALAMAELGIRPPLGNETWQYVKNPFTALIRAESHIEAARNDFKNKYGVDIWMD